MDRIRKALDLARLERVQVKDTSAGAFSHPPEGVSRPVETAVHAPLSSIVYSTTRTFTPDLALLERNRVINPTSPEAAAAGFRMLRTQVLQRLDANGWRSLAVFSPGDQDGKTTTAINLAVSLAAGRLHTVLLVDFDLRNPTIASRLGVDVEVGVDDVLLGDASLEQCLCHPEGYDRLVVLPARSALKHSSELIAGPRGRELVSEIRRRYRERLIVFDLPPVLTADDALAFAPSIECGLVVAAEGRTRRNDLVRTVELLAKTPLLGTVLNRASDTPLRY